MSNERVRPPFVATRGEKVVVSVDTMDLLYDLLNGQASNIDSRYAQGMFNGMELVLSTIEKRRPMFLNANGDDVSTHKPRKQSV